ncbi:zinc ribbon domain-containing protein [Lachnoanaerobaculum umeaense]|jgi:hypothetical protein|uniref:Zinc ribbon domain-containing protein n=1 Tax=Lachnoanaerobaculum umeaense TaxID=617123 RepID=A0A385Q1G4_9FIRM|nr:zinc ribbon domain-containing protein [Lachnoanaerobaculum umeaense]AYA99417.1 zinc ribbon domain-containing protein [Lachnoanaerobaculum umeaense]PZW99517.1 zinc ribbon protein [Lachnoanaerobaculum umeaense]
MKSKLKYLICLFAFLFLTACGGVVNTDMSFDDSFSGSRVMTYTISNSDYTSYVQKDLTTVESTLRELCPQDIEITSFNQDDENIVVVFTISFISEEDYKTKVNNILSAEGIDIVPNVTFLKSDAVFAKGLAYQENFSSDDLLKWMRDGIMGNGFVTSSYESYIFSSSYISLIINGEEYEKDASMSIIDVNTAKYLPIDSVEFDTVLNKDGTIDRTIDVNIPDSTFVKAKDEIEQFMASRVGDIGSGTWTEDASIHIFTIEGKGLGIDECKKMTENFTGKSVGDIVLMTASELKASYAEENSTDDDESEDSDSKYYTLAKQHIFYKNYFWSENIDLEDYISNRDNCVRFNYFVNPQNGYEGIVAFDDNVSESTDISLNGSDGDSNVLLFSGYCKSADLNVEVNVMPSVSKYKHIVDITPTGNIKRNITVVFKESFNENDVKKLEEKLKIVFEKTKIKLDKIELNGSDLEVKISSNLSVDDDTKMWEDATGYSRDSTNLDIDKKGYFVSKQNIKFTDDFHHELFTAGDVESYEYRVKNAGKPIRKSGYISGGFDSAEAKFSGNDFVIKGENVVMSHYKAPSIVSVRTNYIKYIILTIVAVTAIFIIAVLLVIQIKKSKKKVAKSGNSVYNNTQADAVFCPHCGTKNKSDDKFCSSCGKEIS